MKLAEAFRRAMFEFDVTGAELAKHSGMSASQISAFKKGKWQLQADSIDRLIAAMKEVSPEAASFMFNLVLDRGAETLARSGSTPPRES